MSEHANIARLRDAYAAFGKGDLEALQAIWSPQLRWHVPGKSDLAGTYEGIPAVLGFLGQVLERTDGTFRAEPESLFANDSIGVAVVRMTGRRNGRDLEVRNAQISRFENGKVVEFEDASTDLDELDQFFT
jgi:hypothetical protein